MSCRHQSENGYMYGSIILVASVILISLALLSIFILPGYAAGQETSTSMNILTDNLALAGVVTGYADLAGLPPDPPAKQVSEVSSGMNAVRLNLRLASLRMNWATGTGDDLSQATVFVETPMGIEIIPRKTTSVFSRPGWSIVRKRGILPGTSADTDDILEPNEMFSILVSPSANLAPGTPFTITMTIPHVRPLSVERVVPVSMKPVMNLG
jgi:hypothetical protein